MGAAGSPCRDQVSCCEGASFELMESHCAGRNADGGKEAETGANGKIAGERARRGGGSCASMYFQ